MYRYLTKLNNWIMTGAQWIVIFLLGTMSISLFFSVVSRYLFNYSFHMVDAYNRFGLIWLTFIGMPLALRKREHVGVNNIIKMLDPFVRKWVIRIGTVLILIFACVMFTQGISLFNVAMKQIIPEMGISMSNVYIIIPGSAAFLILVALEILFGSDIDTISSG